MPGGALFALLTGVFRPEAQRATYHGYRHIRLWLLHSCQNKQGLRHRIFPLSPTAESAQLSVLLCRLNNSSD